MLISVVIIILMNIEAPESILRNVSVLSGMVRPFNLIRIEDL